MIRDLVLRNRTTRRFDESTAVTGETLRGLIDLGRLSASGANMQPLKYMMACDSEQNGLIFPHLRWAGYLKDWPGPSAGERPSAYVIVLCDTEIGRSCGCDHGIAAQSILLGATELGLAGCMIGSIDRPALRAALSIPERYEIMLVLALGRPRETVVLEDTGIDGDTKYWRDPKGVHHVPKRSLDDIIIGRQR